MWDNSHINQQLERALKQAQVLFVNPVHMIRVYTAEPDHLVGLAEQLLADGHYAPGPTFSVDADDAEGAAEEMFDLSNNPSRVTERNVKYGWTYRSISVGDIIVVDGANFFCAPTGWVAC